MAIGVAATFRLRSLVGGSLAFALPVFPWPGFTRMASGSPWASPACSRTLRYLALARVGNRRGHASGPWGLSPRPLSRSDFARRTTPYEILAELGGEISAGIRPPGLRKRRVRPAPDGQQVLVIGPPGPLPRAGGPGLGDPFPAFLSRRPGPGQWGPPAF